MNKKTNEQFLEDLKLRNPKALEYEILDKYVTNTTKLRVRDKYGILVTNANRLMSGNMPSIQMAENKHEYYINMLKDKNPRAYNELVFLQEYNKANEKILAINKYGLVRVIPDTLLSGFVPNSKCAVDPHNYFLNLIYDVNIEYKKLKFITKFTKTTDYIYAVDEFGVIKTKPTYLLTNRMPNIDSAVDKTSYWINMAKSKRLDRCNTYDYSKFLYKNNTHKSIFICKIHGEFKQSPLSHLNNRGCPKCTSSLGETRIREELKRHDLYFEEQYSFDDCVNKYRLPFDFAINIEGETVLMEYDGEFHYMAIASLGGERALEKTIINDKIKNKYCEDKGIKLIRIPYWEYNNIEKIIKSELNLYEKEI